jgi:hypothetical protein
MSFGRIEFSWIGWPRWWQRWAYVDRTEACLRYWCGPWLVTVWKYSRARQRRPTT